MLQRPLFTLILSSLLLWGGLHLLHAQESTPVIPPPRPVALTCDPAALRHQQAELSARLTTFALDDPAAAGAALDALFVVGGAYQELALTCGYIPSDIAERPAGTDVERILRLLPEVVGDPLNGQVLYNGGLACAGCHRTVNRVGPSTEGTYTRVEEVRLSDPLLAGYTVPQYLVESIVQPGAYVVPGRQNVMPDIFGKSLSLQQLADVVAYLESQDGESLD